MCFKGYTQARVGGWRAPEPIAPLPPSEAFAAARWDYLLYPVAVAFVAYYGLKLFGILP